MSKALSNQLFGMVMAQVQLEANAARAKYPRVYASPHEAMGVLSEEFDEYKDEVHSNDRTKQFKELKQVAAVAMLAMHDLLLEDAAGNPGGGKPVDDRPKPINDAAYAC